MADRYGMADRHWDMLRQTMARYPGIKRVILFGSRATGRNHPGSDFDIAVEAPDMTAHDWAQLSDAIHALPLVYPIDLVWLDGEAGDKLKQRALKEGETVFSARDIYRPAA